MHGAALRLAVLTDKSNLRGTLFGGAHHSVKCQPSWPAFSGLSGPGSCVEDSTKYLLVHCHC